MHLFRLAFPLIAIGAILVQPAAAQKLSGRETQLPTEQLLNRHGLTRSWWSHATINSQRDKLVFMVVDETHLFLQSSSGLITAFDTETGKYLWTRQIGVPDRAVYEVSSNDTLLFVVNGLRLYAVKKRTGDIVWQLALPGMPASSPRADDKQVYVGFVDGSVYAFDLKKTNDLQSASLLPRYSDSAVVWRYRTSKTITSAPVPADTVVAFASRNGSLYSVTKDLRKLVFQFETDAALTAPVIRYRDRLLLASEDSNFYSIDIHKGTLVWQFTAGTVIRRAPVLVGSDVYLFPEFGSMRKMSAETGEVQWVAPNIKDFLAETPHRVYVTDQQNNLVVLAGSTGEQISKFSIGQFIHHLANDRSDRIYLATDTGLVVCLHERGREFARFHKHPERQPILPEFAPDTAGSAAAEGTEEPAAAEEAMPAETDQPEAEMPADNAGDPPAAAEDLPEADDKPAAEEKPEGEEEMQEEKAGDENPPAAEESTEEMSDEKEEKPEAEKSADDPGDEKPASESGEKAAE